MTAPARQTSRVRAAAARRKRAKTLESQRFCLRAVTLPSLSLPRTNHTHPLNKTFSKKTFHPSLPHQSSVVNTSNKCVSVTRGDKPAGQRHFLLRAASPFCRAQPRPAARSPNQVTLTQASRLSPFWPSCPAPHVDLEECHASALRWHSTVLPIPNPPRRKGANLSGGNPGWFAPAS